MRLLTIFALLILNFGCKQEIVIDRISLDEQPIVVIEPMEIRTPFIPAPDNSVDDSSSALYYRQPTEEITLTWTTGGDAHRMSYDTSKWGTAPYIVGRRARKAWFKNPPDKH